MQGAGVSIVGTQRRRERTEGGLGGWGGQVMNDQRSRVSFPGVTVVIWIFFFFIDEETELSDFPNIYTFDTDIPVGIYDGKLTINFKDMI